MTKTKRIRDLVFIAHRYIGLAVGIVLAIVGLTGSILVFIPELITMQIAQALPTVVPKGDRLPIEVLYDRAAAYLKTKAPGDRIDGFSPSDYHVFQPNETIYVRHIGTTDTLHGFYLNPYTGEVIGDDTKTSAVSGFWEWAIELHEALLAGDLGLYFVGIVGLLATILAITGIVLWPGWRKLTSGFKIKWSGHIKRRNFDLHKVVGIIVSIFLAMATFTGFCWNLAPWATPAIYALTLTNPSTADSAAVSKPLPGMENVDLLRQQLPKIAPTIKTQFPDWELANAYIDDSHQGTITAIGCLRQHHNQFINFAFDKYSGNLIRRLGQNSLGDRIMGSFTAVHYGTFAGLPSRILYIFVGLSPTILLITGFSMWKLRKGRRTSSKSIAML